MIIPQYINNQDKLFQSIIELFLSVNLIMVAGGIFVQVYNKFYWKVMTTKQALTLTTLF